MGSFQNDRDDDVDWLHGVSVCSKTTNIEDCNGQWRILKTKDAKTQWIVDEDLVVECGKYLP